MDVSDLLDIKAICDAGSYRKAAEALGVTQPTLSNRIAYLEGKLGAGSRLANLLVEIAGASGGTPGDIEVEGGCIDVLTTFYNARPATIYGGSNEIQRNILATSVLQLPA
mgnify:CR=1 FL=1